MVGVPALKAPPTACDREVAPFSSFDTGINLPKSIYSNSFEMNGNKSIRGQVITLDG